MKILYVEPYYAGSHEQWIKAYQKHSSHQVDIISLPGKKYIELLKKFLTPSRLKRLSTVPIRIGIPELSTLLCNKLFTLVFSLI